MPMTSSVASLKANLRCTYRASLTAVDRILGGVIEVRHAQAEPGSGESPDSRPDEEAQVVQRQQWSRFRGTREQEAEATPNQDNGRRDEHRSQQPQRERRRSPTDVGSCPRGVAREAIAGAGELDGQWCGQEDPDGAGVRVVMY